MTSLHVECKKQQKTEQMNKQNKTEIDHREQATGCRGGGGEVKDKTGTKAPWPWARVPVLGARR